MVKKTVSNDNEKSKSDFNVKNQLKLEKQISVIEIRQQELQNLIAVIQNNISQLEGIIQSEEVKPVPNNEKIKNIRAAIHKNISLLREIYDSYNSFEETKFKYRKLISDNDFNLYRLDITVKQAEEKSNKLLGNDFIEMLRSISTDLNKTDGKSVLIEKINSDLNKNPEFEL